MGSLAYRSHEPHTLAIDSKTKEKRDTYVEVGIHNHLAESRKEEKGDTYAIVDTM